MLSIIDRAGVSDALNDHELDTQLKALIGRRAWQLHVRQGRLFGSELRFIVIQGGDTPDAITEALGFTITGDHADVPGYSWIKDHGLWFEIAIEFPKGRVLRVLVENNDGAELAIHHLCMSNASPEIDGAVQ